MSLIAKELVKINFIVAQFVDERKVYEGQSVTITDKFKNIIETLAQNFGLTALTSVRNIKHYSFSPRVKDAESLKEKLIRNNLLNDFRSIIPDDFNPNDVELIRAVKDKLLGCDDLIGLKILTDINIDCINMFELVSSSEFKAKAKAQNIALNQSDIEKQPEPMRNGLDIYKVKGTYDKYNFELQIKSKIMSAWGDMEHSIFYKDYAISPVRNTAQKSMNHVGRLLFQIDDFVESIRNANKDYKANADALNFMQWFETEYNNRIKTALDDVGYRMDGISDLLYAAYKEISAKKGIEERELMFDHFEYEIGNNYLQKYAAIRNKVYDLKILESVILSWFLPTGSVINQDNVEDILVTYMTLLMDSTASYLCEKHKGIDLPEMKEKVQMLYFVGITYDCNEKFLLSLIKLNDYFTTCFYIDDLAEDLFDSNMLDYFKKVVFVILNKGRVNNILSDFLLVNNPAIDRQDFQTAGVELLQRIKEKDKKNKINLYSLTKKIIELI